MSRYTVADVITRWRQYNELGLNVPYHAKVGYLEFDRQVLKSYRVPIACYHPPRFYSNKNGYVLVLSEHINTPWGTMAKHKSMAARMVTWDKFWVPDVGTGSMGMASPSALAQAHVRNGKWFVEQLNVLADAATKQFKVRNDEAWGSVPRVMHWLFNNYTTIENYMTTTGAEFELPPLDEIAKRVITEREKLWIKWTDPKAMARRERAKARKEAIIALGLEDDA